MKRKFYNLFSGTKQGLFVLALTVLSLTAISQTTYTFLYTGAVQTIALPAGNYSIQCWGADGGNANNGSLLMSGGNGGYATGTYSTATSVTLNVYVGGHGGNASGASNLGAGGGGMSDVTTSTNTNVIIIAAGGGGGGTAGSSSESSTGGDGGGLTGGTAIDGSGVSTGGAATGGSQSAGGSATAGSYGAGSPGGFGYGGGGANGGTAGVMHGAGGAGGSGGNGGWNGGGGACTSTSGNDHAAGGGAGYYGGGGGRGDGGAGGGGSSFIGGVFSAATGMFGQPAYVSNPDAAGNGRVHITELCTFDLYASGSNSLNPVICSGQTLTLSTNAISNYSWSTGATSSSLVVSPTSNTVYALTATSPSNCNTTRTISVIVSSAPPVLSITQSTTSTCLGNTVNVNATGALTYTWSHGVSNNVSFTPAATAVYTVTGENGCGITQATTTITIAQLPVVGVASPPVICENEAVQLSATGATTYTWEPTSQTGSAVISSASVTTIFTVTGESGNCMGQHTFTVMVNPKPVINIAGTATRVCLGTPVTLTVSGADTYTWVQNLSGNIVSDTPSISTLYQVAGTNSFNCTSGNNHIVVVDNPPAMNTNLTSTAICSGSQVALFATGATSYTWSTGATTSSLMASPASFSVYSVSGGHNTNTCTAVEQITVNPITPFLNASASAAICEGAAITLTAGPGTGITWSPGGAFPILSNISPASTTVYTVTAIISTLNVNCPAVNMVTVTVNPNPSVTINAAQTSICRRDPITLTAQGAQTFSWSTGETGASITYTSGSSGSKNITVEGTDNNGCKSTGSLLLMVTPCTGLSEWVNAEVQIYPNPSTGAFVVKSTKSVKVVVYNALGQPLKSVQIDPSAQLEMDELAGGLYFVNIDDGNSTIVKTVVVNR